MTTDSSIRGTTQSLSGRIFDFCPSFYVTWLWSSQYVGVDRQSRTGLIYINIFAIYRLLRYPP